MFIKKVNIGFVLSPGFRVADVIELDAVLRAHPGNKMFYIGETVGIVEGKSGFGIKADTTFEECPELDVLIVGEMTPDGMLNPVILEFISKKTPLAKYVIGVSSGVKMLYDANVISNQKVTADRFTLSQLKQTGLELIDERRCVTDGKFFTAGPSTGGIEAAFIVMKKLRGNWITKFSELTLEYNADVQFPWNISDVVKQPDLPRSLKVGVFTDNHIYSPDIMGATDVFGSIPNAQLYFLANEKGVSKPIVGFGPNLKSTTTLDECPPLDVLIIGATHPRYIKDKKVLDFILKQEKSSEAIISVCAGTFLVGSTGLLAGKNATTNIQQVRDLSRIGANYTGEEVAVDDKYFSAGPAVGSYVVGLKAVEKLIGQEWAQYIEHEVLEFAPKPLFGVTMKNAPLSMKIVTALFSFVVKRIFRPAIKKGYYGQKIRK